MEQFGRDVITSVLTDITEEKLLTNQLTVLTNNIPGGLAKYRIDKQGMHALYLSEGVYKITGYNKDEYDSMSCGNARFVVYSEDIGLINNGFNVMMSQGTPLDISFRIHHKSGGLRWINLRGNISERRGDSAIIDTLFIDITDKKLTEESLRRSRKDIELANQLITDSSSAVYVCDAENFKLLYVNRKCASMCGKSIDDAKGKTCYQFLKNTDKPCNPCYMTYSNDKEYTEREYSSEASGRHFLTRGKFINWDGRRALVEYLTDETERTNARRGLFSLVNGLPCGIGIYNYFYDGRIEMQFLNDGYYSVIGTKRTDREKYTGFSVTDAIHPDDLILMGKHVANAVRENTPIDIDIRVRSGSGEYKWLNIRANIASRDNDKAVIYAAYSDIDDEKKHHLQLEASRRILDTANKEGRIALWVLNIDKKQIINNISGNNVYGFESVIDNVPQFFIDAGVVHEDDKQKFIDMYDRLYGGDDRSECTVRLIDRRIKRFVWQHIIYTRSDDTYYGNNTAVGICTDVDNEYEMRLQYEYEVHMRQEILRDSLIYYQLNLTSGIIEAYGTNLNDIPSMSVMSKVSDGTRGEILDNIAPEHREAVKNTLFTDALIAAYGRKEYSVSLEYRRKVSRTDFHWVLSTVKITQRPDTNEIIAFLNTKDIDTEKKNRFALDSVIGEEIQTVSLINVRSGLERLLNVRKNLHSDMLNQTFFHDEMLRKLVDTELYEDEKERCLNSLLLHNMVEALDRDGNILLSFRVWRADGSIRRKRAYAFYLDDTHEDIVVSDRDVTRGYETEEKQRQVLQNAVDAANKANRAKSEFLSKMSHSMRTPLNAVIGMVGLTRKENISEQAQKYLSDIDTASHLLLVLIDDILDTENIDKGHFSLKREQYYTEEFLQCINAVIKPMLDEKKALLKINLASGVDFIITDRMRFTQVFFNLLANASKYAQEGDTVELTSHTIPDKNGLHGIRYNVKSILKKNSDTSNTNSTADRYSDKASSAADDLRSDINIVNKLIKAMGGELTVVSDAYGCEYSVDFYTDTVFSTHAPMESGIHKLRLDGKRLLLVEDNKMNTLVAQRLLENQGCIVTTAQDGKEGAEKFINSPSGSFDAILMDIRMPVMNGIDATIMLRNSGHPDSKNVPIIAMTAEARPTDEEKWTAAGINAQLYKPIEPELLFDILTKLTDK